MSLIRHHVNRGALVSVSGGRALITNSDAFFDQRAAHLAVGARRFDGRVAEETNFLLDGSQTCLCVWAAKCALISARRLAVGAGFDADLGEWAADFAVVARVGVEPAGGGGRGETFLGVRTAIFRGLAYGAGPRSRPRTRSRAWRKRVVKLDIDWSVEFGTAEAAETMFLRVIRLILAVWVTTVAFLVAGCGHENGGGPIYVLAAFLRPSVVTRLLLKLNAMGPVERKRIEDIFIDRFFISPDVIRHSRSGIHFSTAVLWFIGVGVREGAAVLLAASLRGAYSGGKKESLDHP